VEIMAVIFLTHVFNTPINLVVSKLQKVVLGPQAVSHLFMVLVVNIKSAPAFGRG
jgi:hypothetical protein